MSKRKCGACGHDPACGYASVWNAESGETWLCHDDGCDCYSPPFLRPGERHKVMSPSDWAVLNEGDTDG